MQNRRENSFGTKWNLNWSESAIVNLSTVMAEWLLNFELSSFKESERSKYRNFKLFSFLFNQDVFIRLFTFDSNATDVKLFPNSVTCSLTLRHVTENRYVKYPVHFFLWNIISRWDMNKLSNQKNCRKTNEHKEN